MKKLLKNISLITLVFTFVFIGCTNDETTTNASDHNRTESNIPDITANVIQIGYIKDGTPEMTFDTKKALRTLSRNMRKIGVNETYTSVYVANVGNAYNLLFEGDTYRTSFYVEVVESDTDSETVSTTRRNALVVHHEITCTTSECSQESTGCVVKYDAENGDLPYCSPCANGGKCIKTAMSEKDAASIVEGVF
ncbi:MAG: hypothetical protein AAF611_11775 [Bacteroidota bacterium]